MRICNILLTSDRKFGGNWRGWVSAAWETTAQPASTWETKHNTLCPTWISPVCLLENPPYRTQPPMYDTKQNVTRRRQFLAPHTVTFKVSLGKARPLVPRGAGERQEAPPHCHRRDILIVNLTEEGQQIRCVISQKGGKKRHWSPPGKESCFVTRCRWDSEPTSTELHNKWLSRTEGMATQWVEGVGVTQF